MFRQTRSVLFWSDTLKASSLGWFFRGMTNIDATGISDIDQRSWSFHLDSTSYGRTSNTPAPLPELDQTHTSLREPSKVGVPEESVIFWGLCGSEHVLTSSRWLSAPCLTILDTARHNADSEINHRRHRYQVPLHSSRHRSCQVNPSQLGNPVLSPPSCQSKILKQYRDPVSAKHFLHVPSQTRSQAQTSIARPHQLPADQRPYFSKHTAFRTLSISLGVILLVVHRCKPQLQLFLTEIRSIRAGITEMGQVPRRYQMQQPNIKTTLVPGSAGRPHVAHSKPSPRRRLMA